MNETTWLNQAREKAASCVQCGYCLPACPTYQVTGQETHSPRGRIHLIKMAAEGQLSLEAVIEPLDLCLACRACESACPSGVEYGYIHGAARRAMAAVGPEPPLVQKTRRWVLRHIVPDPVRMRWMAHMLWAYQHSGIRYLVRKTEWLSRLPGHLGQWETILPEVPSPRRRRLPRYLAPKHHATVKRHEKPVKIGFLHGCIMEVLFHRVNRLSMELLARCGYEVVLLNRQTCCGALHAHTGEEDLAVQLAKQNIEAAETAEVDWIVSNAGGCGAHLHEYPTLFVDDPAWQARARIFASKVRDISQLLWEAPMRPAAKPLPVTVTYQPSCHLTHVQKVTDAPRQLIQSIPDIQFREMPSSGLCCGSAGIYNLLHFDMAMQIGALKTADIRNLRATAVITSNPGCHLQLQMAIRQAGLEASVRVLHLVELLAEAWEVDIHRN